MGTIASPCHDNHRVYKSKRGTQCQRNKGSCHSCSEYLSARFSRGAMVAIVSSQRSFLTMISLRNESPPEEKPKYLNLGCYPEPPGKHEAPQPETLKPLSPKPLNPKTQTLELRPVWQSYTSFHRDLVRVIVLGRSLDHLPLRVLTCTCSRRLEKGALESKVRV